MMVSGPMAALSGSLSRSLTKLRSILRGLTRKALKITERGIPGSEIIDLDMKAEVPEGLEDCHRFVRIAHQCAFGDLQPKPVRVDA